MNHIENGIATADTNAGGAIPKSVVTTAGDVIYATGNAAVTRLALGAAGTVLKGGASAPSFATIVNSDIDPAAAIARTKLADPPQARATKSAAQSMTSGSWALVTWDTESFDTDTIHDLVTNNDRLTCKTAGVYLVCVNLEWASNTTGIRAFQIQKNDSGLPGTAIVGGNSMTTPSSGITLEQPASILVNLVVNDYLTLAAFQNSGGALNIQTNSSFAMTRISS